VSGHQGFSSAKPSQTKPSSMLKENGRVCELTEHLRKKKINNSTAGQT